MEVVRWCISICCVTLMYSSNYLIRCADNGGAISVQRANPLNVDSSAYLSNATLYNERCTNYNYKWFKAHGYYTVCSGLGSCVEGDCHCLQDYYGMYCELKKCTDGCVHGTCITDGQCICDYGYEGDICDIIGSERVCDYRSEVYNEVNRSCECRHGYIRNKQSQKCREYHCKSDYDCGFHGECKEKKCTCKPAYSGIQCEIANCTEQSYYNEQGDYVVCNNHGRCDGGKCSCEFGYEGDFCEHAECVNFRQSYCHYHGNCTDLRCVCETGYSGKRCEKAGNCDEYEADGDHITCNKHGVCVGGNCTCDNGYGGAFCEKEYGCEDSYSCNQRGRCNSGRCQCNTGYSGPICTVANCTEQSYYDENGAFIECNNHGRCDGDKCICESGYGGGLCEEEYTCHGEQDCHFGGSCINYRCVCRDGYSGPNCGTVGNCTESGKVYDVESGQKAECSNHGICEKGRCNCDSGYHRAFCEMEIDCSASYPCSFNGNCSDGKCTCNVGYTGSTCATAVSCKDYPDNYNDTDGRYIVCNGRGMCDGHDYCTCEPGYQGAFCEEKSNCYGAYSCSYHGHCFDEKCVCDTGYSGVACGTVESCYDYKNNYYKLNGDYVVCSDHGRCDRGNCTCNPGYTGDFCETEMGCTDEYDCNERGSCTSNECRCNDYSFGKYCQGQKNCVVPSTGIWCNRNGGCSEGNCICDPGYTGKYCDGKIEDSHCYNYEFYYSVNESMAVEYSDLYNLCCGHGECKEGNCSCEVGYTGRYCDNSDNLACIHWWGTGVCNNNGECVNKECICNPGYIGAYCDPPGAVREQITLSWIERGDWGYLVGFLIGAIISGFILVACKCFERYKSGTGVPHRQLEETETSSTDELAVTSETKIELEELPSVHLPLKDVEKSADESFVVAANESDVGMLPMEENTAV